METYILIFIAASIGFFNNAGKPTEYQINMEDGTKTNVVVHKNSKYACPLYCEVNHVHHAVMIDEDIINYNNKSLYHISESSENIPVLFCSDKKILSMNRFKPKAVDNELPEVFGPNLDLVISNATIEHVGSEENQIKMIKNIIK